MIAWKDHVALPAMRSEIHFSGREILCFEKRPPSFYWMFERAVKERPQHECISFNDQYLSYADVSAQVDKLAHGFAARGLQKGDRVVMFISNRPEFITVLFALQ
ncbi:MAG: AMP-binding protein, partial [bacterium]